jgi:broad specificity phosphatase PhoE
MTLELYLIRHAESFANLNPSVIGGRSSASPLTPRGEQQACALGKRLRSEGFTPRAFYHSTAERARHTAHILMNELDYHGPFGFSVDLEEISQGEWEGKRRDEVFTPELRTHARRTQPDFAAPRGESQRNVANRFDRYLRTMLFTTYRNGAVVVVSHGFAIRSWVGLKLGWNPWVTVTALTENTSITQLDYRPQFNGSQGEWNLVRFNDHAHLKRGVNR